MTYRYFDAPPLERLEAANGAGSDIPSRGLISQLMPAVFHDERRSAFKVPDLRSLAGAVPSRPEVETGVSSVVGRRTLRRMDGCFVTPRVHSAGERRRRSTPSEVGRSCLWSSEPRVTASVLQRTRSRAYNV